jgi:hypothetical protein
MSEERRRAISTPGDRPDPASRGPGSVALSVAIHVVAIVALVQILLIPSEWVGLLQRSPARPHQERIGFLQLPSTTERARAGGDNRPISAHPSPAPQLVAPQEVPSTLPAAPKAAVVQDSGGTGPVVGPGGAVRGVTPQFADHRVWEPAPPPGALPLPTKQKLDSAISARVHELQDSLAALGPGGRAPGDWTFDKDGKKYGIDQKYIHLGDFSLPTAVLALLPLNATANPTAIERERRLSAIRTEIQDQAARQVRDEEFRAAVKRLRERKDKERADSKKTTVDTTVTTSVQP